MSCSQDGSRIAILGSSGYIHIMNGNNKNWIMNLKMNCMATAFTFYDEYSGVSSGIDADIYQWDLRYTGRCINR